MTALPPPIDVEGESMPRPLRLVRPAPRRRMGPVASFAAGWLTVTGLLALPYLLGKLIGRLRR